jgi:RNA polymerase sigma-70 factor (ECF subfamily)
VDGDTCKLGGTEMAVDRHPLTVLLVAWQQGDEEALARLTEVVYGELRRLAAHRLAGERSHHTLQPTELVNETLLRLLGAEVPWSDRVHFFAVAARTMRRVLVDHARARQRRKRDAGAIRVTLTELHAPTPTPPLDVIDLDRALDALSALDAEQGRMLELHFFGGMTLEEIAAATSRPRSTVHRLVRSGQAWLHRELAGAGPERAPEAVS